MEWLQCIQKALHYMEEHLLDEITVEDVSNDVFSSKYNFQRVFHLVTGVTLGEYIRNRRLSLAGRELQLTDCRVVDIALKYRYETSESFSKAFSRFHGITPTDVKMSGARLKFFHPLMIYVFVQGGFCSAHPLMDEFCWSSIEMQNGERLTNSEKYQRIVRWAEKARRQNPDVFDTLTEWLLDDSEWGADRLDENKEILMQGIFVRFQEQNTHLREYLSELKSSGAVNEAVFRALDHFDEALSGKLPNKELQAVVASVISDFSVMEKHSVRAQIAGSRTGSTGMDHADLYGYINHLKDCDAEVQWTLFMPDKVKWQQNGFRVDHFEYKRMSAMRFIGVEGGQMTDTDRRTEIFRTLDAMSSHRSGFDFDVFLFHHYGLPIDIGPQHGFWGRFMKQDTPVPEGFIYFDFVPDNDGRTGAPYLSQFAYAVFSGDIKAMHSCEGYDRGAMYDVTRNIMLGQGINIPYPEKYWTAEVFLDGYDRYSTAYMFSAEFSTITQKKENEK